MEQSGVDQVWARLKAATGQPSMDGIVGKVLRNGSSKTANLLLPLGGQSVAFLGLNDGQDDDVDQSSITAWQGATDLDRGDLETACRPYIQQLTDERISIRKAGMANIQKAVYCPLVSPGDVTDALSSWLGKALVKSIADTAQCIRTSAISMFRVLIEQHPDAILPMLPYAMPVLEGRLHVDENSNRQEQSEEIRLLLLQVWHGSKLITAITNSAP